ncbi:MFS transporter [Kribbella sp. NPDC051770]|uniref:MFS transporter n=1 Tax=Kribbella sp. NPDC051770 TaxID=3155413 RepID=UPI00341853CC
MPGFSLWRIAVPAFGPTVLNAVGQGAVLPVVALSALQLGASVGFAAFLVGVLGIGQFAGSLPAGALVVRIGERRALLVAAVVSAVAWCAAMVVRTPWLLGISLLVAGLAGAVFSLARQSYVTEVVPVELRARALSTLGGVSRIGLFIGPFLGRSPGTTGACPARTASAWPVRSARSSCCSPPVNRRARTNRSRSSGCR